jgi:hypothetical protein
MKKFRVQFTGRKIKAIGKLANFFVTVESDTVHNAIISLYDYYEHIHVLTVDGLVYKNLSDK